MIPIVIIAGISLAVGFRLGSQHEARKSLREWEDYEMKLQEVRKSWFREGPFSAAALRRQAYLKTLDGFQ